MDTKDRGDIILRAICEDVNCRLNPDGDDCPECNGDGGTYDCIDGMCADAEDGCPDCYTPCTECCIFEQDKRRAIRKEVIEMGDVDVGIAWLKSVGRWRDDLTAEQIRAALKKAGQQSV